VADSTDTYGSSLGDEVDRFAQLWRDTTPDDDGDGGLMRKAMAPGALVIHAERV